MSWSNVIIFFLSIFFCLYSVIFVNTKIESGTNRANNLYARYVASACKDALEMTSLRNIEIKDVQQDTVKRIWKDVQAREDTVNKFYQSFGLCLNKNGTGFYNELEIMTPVICLVDIDGYYISYNAAFDNNSNSNDEYENVHNINALNTWSQPIGTYVVRYYLSDNVQVIAQDGKIYNGNRKKVYSDIADPSLEFLVMDEIFEDSKNSCIIQTLNEQINYYLNALNHNADSYDTQYIVNLAEVKGDTWCGLIDEPAICAFVQGKTFNIRNKKASVYGFGIYEIGEPLHYFILDNGSSLTYYCYEEKAMQNNIIETDTFTYYQGNEIKKLYSSKQECAQEGAYLEIIR